MGGQGGGGGGADGRGQKEKEGALAGRRDDRPGGRAGERKKKIIDLMRETGKENPRWSVNEKNEGISSTGKRGLAPEDRK